MNHYLLSLVGQFDFYTARQALVDSELIANMTENDLKVLKEGMLRFEKALEKYRGNELMLRGIGRAKAALKFYDDADLKLEISNPSLAHRLRFTDDFGDISLEFILKLKLNNQEYVSYWSQLSDAEKAIARADEYNYFKNWYNEKIDTIVQGWKDWVDGDKNFGYKIYELQTLAEMEVKYKAGFRPTTKGEAGDAIATTGPLAGKSFDAFGTPASAFESDRWKFKYNRSLKELNEAVDVHFAKNSNTSIRAATVG
ncbi:hypothetical protein ABID99_003594 [Mucilaginibacter sp. OAE612]|uniref:hypothetical protein n=1 Tax=Mucilaginibacter sp. OAE612 TaxID=3156444 RepID=UPI00359D00FA